MLDETIFAIEMQNNGACETLLINIIFFRVVFSAPYEPSTFILWLIGKCALKMKKKPGQIDIVPRKNVARHKCIFSKLDNGCQLDSGIAWILIKTIDNFTVTFLSTNHE